MLGIMTQVMEHMRNLNPKILNSEKLLLILYFIKGKSQCYPKEEAKANQKKQIHRGPALPPFPSSLITGPLTGWKKSIE